MAVTSPGLSILGHHFASEQDTCSRGGLVRESGVPPGGGNSILLSDLLRSSKTLEVCVTPPHVRRVRGSSYTAFALLQ